VFEVFTFYSDCPILIPVTLALLVMAELDCDDYLACNHKGSLMP